MLRRVLDRPVSVLVASLGLVAVGAFSLLRLPVALLPSLERPRMVVVARDADASREELLRRVVQPLETRLLSLSGVVSVRSAIDDGVCRLELETEWQTDLDRLSIDAERRLAAVAGAGLDELEVALEVGDAIPILEIALLGGASADARTSFAEKVLVPELGRLVGAGRVESWGGARRRPVVRPLAAALAVHGLSALDVAERLEGLGRATPLGSLRDGARVRALVFREAVASLAELRAVRLGPEGGVRLDEVAEVALEEVPEAGFYLERRRGSPRAEAGVLVRLHRAPGANAVALAREAREVVASLAARSGAGLRLEVVGDGSAEVVAALRRLAAAALLGVLLGTVVLRAILGSWRPTLALVVVVPASILSSFAAFFFWNVALDLVSLAGLALAAGMLVDNSVVVLESIASARARGEARPTEAGTGQIALALVASFLTTAAVFLPLVYLRGLARAFFGVQAFAIVSTLGISLLFSLALTPVLARLGGSPRRGGRSPGLAAYTRLVAFCLGRPALPIALALILFASGALLLASLPRELVPAAPPRALEIAFRLPPDLGPAAAAGRVEHAAAELWERLGEAGPERLHAVLEGGDELLGRGVLGGLSGVLVLDWQRPGGADAAAGLVAEGLATLPGWHFEPGPRLSAVEAAIERSRRSLELEVTALTPRQAERLAERVRGHLERSTGLRLERISAGPRRETLRLLWERPRLARLGTAPRALAPQVRAGLGGRELGRAEIVGGEEEILLEGTLPAAVELLPVVVPREAGEELAGGEAEPGPALPLGALASVVRQERSEPLERLDGRPAVRLRPVASRAPPVAAVASALEGLDLGANETVRLAGQARELSRSFRQLGFALAMALVLVFLTVAAIYESLRLPWVVMSTVPMAVVGAALALAVSGQSLNVMSLLALILLAGIVVNNSIVLVHRGEQLRRSGLGRKQAVAEACRERYRPILITTLTTLLGMLPLALVGGEGVELRRSLAVAVSGGLLSALFASLVLVPVLQCLGVEREAAPGGSG